MNEPLKKFGYLAGKLFAKTVSELKPAESKTEPLKVDTPQIDTPPIVNPEDKLKQVFSLLNSKKVGLNVDELLRRYRFDSDEVITTSEVGISEELQKELEIKDINLQLNFSYKEKSIQILLVNFSSSSFMPGDYRFYGLIIFYNSRCVLVSMVNEDIGEHTTRYTTDIAENSLKSFKNGSWMDDLDFLVRHFHEYEKKQDTIENEKKRKQLADKLDLDPLD